jgi:PAS domain S-box-containing protein
MIVKPDLLAESLAPSPANRDLSARRTLTITILLIFIAEVVAMAIVRYLNPPNYFIATLLDGIIMSSLILPGLYFLQLKPLLQEIRERTRAELALWTTKELLRKVLELLPVGVWITDSHGQIVHGNPASRYIWEGARYVGLDGYGEYKGWWPETGKPVQPEEWAAARAIKCQEIILNEEIEIETFAGERKIILNSAVPILDEKNAVQGAIIVNQDITYSRQKEKALLRANELLERVFLSVDTLIAFMDRDFNFVRVNHNYAKSAGHPIEFLIGKNHFDLYPNEENQAIFRQVVESGEPFTVLEKPFEYPEFPERGVTYWNWSLQPVKGSSGEVDGIVLSLMDVTRLKRAEIQLEHQNRELSELSNAERRQRELAEGLVQAMISLNSSLELDQVLCSILEQIRRTVPFHGADILLVEEKTWRVAGALGFEKYPKSIPSVGQTLVFDGYPLLEQVCSSLQILTVDSVNEHPGWPAKPDQAWVCSYAAIPMVIGGNVMGIIELYNERPAAFRSETAGRLVAYAAPAALALYNARLYRAESDARQVAETLRAAAQALTQALDLEYVIHTLLEYLHRIIPTDIAGVTLLGNETGLGLRIQRGFGRFANCEELPTYPLDGITDPVIRRLTSSRKCLSIPNTIPNPDSSPQRSPGQISDWLLVPILASDNVIGLVELGKAEAGGFSFEQCQWAEAITGQAAIAIQNAWLFDQVRSSSERLQSLARKLVEIQESERLYIARELHDELGQALSSLKLSLGMLEQDTACPPHIRQRLVSLKYIADRVLEDLHQLAVDLRPVTLDRLGLVAALEQYATNLNSPLLSVQFKSVGFNGDRLSRDVETSLFRIVQEAITNVMRHARASNVGILLERAEGSVKVFVEDNGIGFSPEQTEQEGRLGLVGIRERAEMLGGRLTIESVPGAGTSIIVEVPDVHSYPDRG